jgi:hypothetical protein
MNCSATQIDECLSQCWMNVFAMDRPPSDDADFLNCGGSSFDAIRLIRLLHEFGFSNINVAHLFREFRVYKNLRALLLSSHNSVIASSDSIAFTRMEHPLSMTQMYYLLLQRFCPESTNNIETIAIIKHMTEDTSKRAPLITIFSSIIAHHPILSSIVVGNSEIGFRMRMDTTRVCPVVAEDVIDLDEVKCKLQSIPTMTANENTTLICCRHFRLQTPSNVEVYAMHIHHMLIDDVSLRQLENELSAVPKTPHLVKSVNLFNKFVDIEMQFIQSENYQTDRAFWCKLFQELPYEFTQTTAPFSCRSWNDTIVYLANSCSSTLNITKSIHEFWSVKRITAFQYFLTCYLIVLQRYVTQILGFSNLLKKLCYRLNLFVKCLARVIVIYSNCQFHTD